MGRVSGVRLCLLRPSEGQEMKRGGKIRANRERGGEERGERERRGLEIERRDRPVVSGADIREHQWRSHFERAAASEYCTLRTIEVEDPCT